ncbi:MAG: 16S rRNA (uracil(1498)-N(3))-methyltransferase [Deltaproteobacteria bacterium]|nr:16S rRNA (uracil(1498)-N(3))-methyltransferase [Deltaproteobacteria bacterium]
MIRLYFDQTFEVGARLRLPKEELHYFRGVRRGQAEATLFNRQNQIAFGRVDEDFFVIDRVEEATSPRYPLTLALGMPEASILPLVMRSISELGVKELILFEAERSQNAKARMKNLARLEKIAIESARQCGRGAPLEISTSTWTDLLKKFADFERKIFFDEAMADKSALTSTTKNSKNILLMVGPEGGWTEKERMAVRKNDFEWVHFETPILRVETAVVVAAFFGIQKFASCNSK